MKRFKKILLCLGISITLAPAHAQINIEERMIYENAVPGTIIKDGQKTPGYFKAMGTTMISDQTLAAPWEFQDDIRFIEKNTFETAEKIKNKDFTKYGAGDLDGYIYQDSLVFESVKYADMSAVGTGMVAKKMFLRKISDGKITLFHHFSSPPAVDVGEVSQMIEDYKALAIPNVVYRIGAEGKLKLVNSLNVKKELAECPTVVEKFEKGEYGVSGDEEKKSGLAKLADKTVFRDGVRLAAIEDYNVTCK